LLASSTPKKYPPLSYRETVAILKALGFSLKATRGSHEQWEGVRDGIARKVTLKRGVDFDERDIRSHIAQAGVDREAYYGATKRTAEKIS
jgi:predicted RNA binding protein YcfA (HicA-like mRNA interferase family)